MISKLERGRDLSEAGCVICSWGWLNDSCSCSTSAFKWLNKSVCSTLSLASLSFCCWSSAISACILSNLLAWKVMPMQLVRHSVGALRWCSSLGVCNRMSNTEKEYMRKLSSGFLGAFLSTDVEYSLEMNLRSFECGSALDIGRQTVQIATASRYQHKKGWFKVDR